ncbi:septation protein SpoVG family protein [Candidatus Omnitrophota bacterium]
MLDFQIEVKQVYKLDGEGKLKAFVDVAISDLFLVKGLRIVDGKKGLFVGMPRRQGKDGQWYPTVSALNDETKDQLTEIVLEAYQRQ